MSGESAALFSTQGEWRAQLKMDKKEGLTIVVLEGKTDWNFWSKMMDSRKIYITAFKPRQNQKKKNKKKEKMNKAKVIESIYELRHPVYPWRPSRENGIMGLIDSDYWESPFHSDGYLDEQLLSVIKDFLVEEGEYKENEDLGTKISETRGDIITTSPNTDRDNIEFHLNDIVALIGSVSQEDLERSILMAKDIGILRALNDEKQFRLRFKVNNEHKEWRHNCIDNKSMDVSKLLEAVLKRTQQYYKKPKFDELKHEYESAKRRYEELGLTSVELANGHDIDFCLRYLRDVNTKISPKITFDSIRDTTLVKKIRDWEEKNKPYCVLPQ